jgi:two-component system sensor histidine kinase VanS
LLSEANLKLGNDIEFEKQQEEKKKKLIYTINHELKTPLSVMKGMVEGMIDGVGRYQDKDKYLKELIQQIEKIEKITSDLTYSMRLEDKIKIDEFSSTKVLKQTFSDLKEFAQQQNKNLIINIAYSDLIINEELLQIMVRNIVKNAITYTTGVDIEVSSEKNKEDYFFIVKNYGHIKDEDLKKVFDSFYRSDSMHLDHNGSGLGLSIVKHICDLYGYECKLFNDGDYVVTKLRVKRKV